MTKIYSEAELLDQEKRKKLIDDFNSHHNTLRKADAFKAYECLKDKTINYVIELLMKQFELETVIEMQHAMSNLSVLRKVIDKLARVYANGVKRTMPSAKDTKLIEAGAEYLNFNSAMKKANRYFRTFKNTLVYVRPMKSGEFFDIALEVLPPFKYDAVENEDNPELPLAIVLSDYTPTRKGMYAIGDAALAGRSNVRIATDAPVQSTSPVPSTGIVGGSASSDDGRRYIWWTENYHFTTNSKGEIVKPDHSDELSTDNPIGKLPFVNFAGDQDGCFWAEGGSDLVDAGVKINVDLSNLKHLGMCQGYGQLFMTGKNLPKSVKVGPNHCIQLEQGDKDEPTPQIGYLNSNAPITELKELIEMQVALMLTTNNLSTSGFKTALNSSRAEFASGIALIIDKSESIEDIGEQSEVFIKREPLVWDLVAEWFDVYRSGNLLTDRAKEIKLPKKITDVQIQFPSARPVMTEKEQLETLQLRKLLGLNTEVELLMRDDPSLTEEEAQQKLDKIKAEKKANQKAFGIDPNAPADPNAKPGDVNGNQGKEGSGFGLGNNGNAGPDGGAKPAGNGQDPNQK